MIEILPESTEDVLVFSKGGLIDDHDYDRLEEAFRRYAMSRSELRTVIVLENFSGWTLEGVWRRTLVALRYRGLVAATAIVGPEEQAGTLSNLIATVERYPVEAFSSKSLDAAISWVKSIRSVAVIRSDTVSPS